MVQGHNDKASSSSVADWSLYSEMRSSDLGGVRESPCQEVKAKKSGTGNYFLLSISNK